MKNALRYDHGISLLEVILAMTMGTMIMAPLAMGFTVALKDWDENRSESELLQHARVAMQRISSELRYAVRAVDWTSQPLQFYTRTLVNDDWQAEIIKYRLDAPTGILYRSQDTGTEYPLAGAIGLKVSNFMFEPYKIMPDGSFQYLDSSDPVDLADGVRIELDMDTGDPAKPLILISSVKFRNK